MSETDADAGLDRYRLDEMTWRDVERATEETSTIASPETGEALVEEAVGNVAELVYALEAGETNGA